MKKPNPGAAKARAAQAADTQGLVKSMPDNANKPKEIGRANAVSPPVGMTRKPASRAAAAAFIKAVARHRHPERETDPPRV
ncbi:MAG: hypothetical protein ABI671_15380 [Burkholderiales bacterium]